MPRLAGTGDVAKLLALADLAQMTDDASFGAFSRNRSQIAASFLICGSVDDGKSTLIGRLRFDTKLLFDDQLATLEEDSLRHGTNGDNIDFAPLVDGFEAERERASPSTSPTASCHRQAQVHCRRYPRPWTIYV